MTKHPAIVNTMGMDEDEIKRRVMLGDWEICEFCKTVVEWSKLPDENVRTSQEKHEFWGAPCYETVVIGWICPECGYKTDL